MSAVADVTAAWLRQHRAEKPVVAYLRADKRWFHGRLRQQLALGLICYWRGHHWSRGREEDGVVYRRCVHGCGTQRLAAQKDIYIGKS